MQAHDEPSGEFRLEPGTGGWCQYWSPELAGHSAWLRFDQVPPRLGLVYVTEVLVRTGGVFRAETLRHIPVLRLERVANLEPLLGPILGELARWGDRPAAEALIGWEPLSDEPAPTDPSDVRASLMLEIPGKGRSYPDEFFEQLSRAWAEAMLRSGSPTALIATANGVAKRTVDGWIIEARKRGVIPAARPVEQPQSVIVGERPPKQRGGP
jgi:hypothetical protein